VASRSFWERAAGCWAGEASYFDGAMQPIIPAYGNVLRISAVVGGAASVEEWKQYPPSELARAAGGPGLAADAGFEVASVQRGTLGADGVLDFAGDGRWVPFDGHSALRELLEPSTGVPRYRTWHTMPSDDVLVTTNLGVLYTAYEADYYNRPLRDPVSGETRPNARLGQLKGVAIFRYRRIAAAQLDAARAERRATYRVRDPAGPPRTRG
jgi:hypothetical protein